MGLLFLQPCIYSQIGILWWYHKCTLALQRNADNAFSIKEKNVQKCPLGRGCGSHTQSRSQMEQTKYGLLLQNRFGDEKQLLENCSELYEVRIWYRKEI